MAKTKRRGSKEADQDKCGGKMNEDQNVRFLIDENGKGASFVYRPPNAANAKTMDAMLGCKFPQRRVILDDWWLIGGTKWSRALFRLRHLIVYSKRGLRGLCRKIKRIFVKPKMIQPLARHPHAKRPKI